MNVLRGHFNHDSSISFDRVTCKHRKRLHRSGSPAPRTCWLSSEARCPVTRPPRSLSASDQTLTRSRHVTNPQREAHAAKGTGATAGGASKLVERASRPRPEVPKGPHPCPRPGGAGLQAEPRPGAERQRPTPGVHPASLLWPRLLVCMAGTAPPLGPRDVAVKGGDVHSQGRTARVHRSCRARPFPGVPGTAPGLTRSTRQK